MKLWNVLMTGALIYTSAAGALELKCDGDHVFCRENFAERANGRATIEAVAEALPLHVKRNLTFKRGTNIDKRVVGALGPHGHKVSLNNSSSATPEQPRVFVWDETSGFTASWNSGNPQHSAFNRIDLYDFDFKTATHRLEAWIPENGGQFVTASDARYGQRCIDCHGEVQRPILGMYPDWPQFYGEFNDEMTGYPAGALAIRADLRLMANEFQPIERRLFQNFLNGEGRSNPRYSILLEARPSRSSGNSVYPYRPATTTAPFSNVSRAFANRPNLRLGLLYNRLTALQTFEKIKRSPVFRKYPDIVFYSLLDCSWDPIEGKSAPFRSRTLGKLLGDLQKYDNLKDVNLRGAKFAQSDIDSAERGLYSSAVENGATVYYRTSAISDRDYRQMPYEDLLRILDLKIQDLDIRFRHDSSLKVAKGYNVYDPKAYYNTDSAMDIGYLKDSYRMNPICDNNSKRCKFSYDGTYMQGMRFFNSYFDGSASMNELLAAQMLLFLTDRAQDFSQDPALSEVRQMLRSKISNPQFYMETLTKKYDHFEARYELDKPFFDKMDAIGPWIQLPFPPDLLNIHNREAFWSEGRTGEIRRRIAQWNSARDRASDRQNRNGGNNLCWNVHDVLEKRY